MLVSGACLAVSGCVARRRLKANGMTQSATALTHDWIWRAIDTLARQRGLSPSGLARLSGLDPTTFNPSKRFTPEGRPRWPSTESLSKLLAATDTSLDAFAALEIEPGGASALRKPQISLAIHRACNASQHAPERQRVRPR
jgi:phage repressor protein C with HTH and peptisase S24 domain